MSDKKREEEDNIAHAIHGVKPIQIVGGRQTPEKGVTIMDKHGIRTDRDENKGVEIHDPRNG